MTGELFLIGAILCLTFLESVFFLHFGVKSGKDPAAFIAEDLGGYIPLLLLPALLLFVFLCGIFIQIRGYEKK